MEHQAVVAVEDLTQKASGSNLAVIVRFEAQDRYIEVFKSGIVRLISSAGTVSARFKELEKRDLLRQSYIQSLLVGGMQGEELEQSLQAIARVDRRLAEETDAHTGITGLERRTEAHLHTWVEAQGLDYESLSEEEFMALVQRGVAKARKAKSGGRRF